MMAETRAVTVFLAISMVALMSVTGCDWDGYAIPGPIEEWDLDLDTQGLGSIFLDPPGQDCGTSVVGDFIEGTVVTITITPNTDYEFVRIDWQGGGQTTDNPSQVTMDADKTGLVVLEPK